MANDGDDIYDEAKDSIVKSMSKKQFLEYLKTLKATDYVQLKDEFKVRTSCFYVDTMLGIHLYLHITVTLGKVVGAGLVAHWRYRWITKAACAAQFQITCWMFLDRIS